VSGDLVIDVGGREVAAHLVGAISERVVLYHHGSTGGRLSVRLLHDLAVDAGVTVVGVDRPGYGLSAPARFTFASVAADAAAVAAALGVEQVWVVGQSSGAAYALATAALEPGLVRAVALGGSVIPLEPGSAGWARLSDAERRGLALVGRDDDEAERLLGLEDAEYALECQFADHEQLAAEALAENPGSSPEQERDVRLRAAALRDGLCRGMAGWGRDNVVRMAHWGFPLEEIRCPVMAWFGQQDSQVAEKVSWLHERIPGLRPNVVADAGHNVLFERWGDVLADLIAP
jgi:pimeloyl-ACP methyl ester carboxylesterase